MTLEETIKRYKNHSECIHQTLITKEEAINVYEWLRVLKEIWDSGDCNDCLHQNNCTIRPQLGQLVRFNCYQYERGIQNDNDNN